MNKAKIFLLLLLSICLNATNISGSDIAENPSLGNIWENKEQELKESGKKSTNIKGLTFISGKQINVGGKNSYAYIDGTSGEFRTDTIMNINSDEFINKGKLNIFRKKGTPIILNIKGDLYGTDVDVDYNKESLPDFGKTEKYNSAIGMVSKYTNNGTDTDLIKVNGNVYGYTQIIPKTIEEWDLSKENQENLSEPVALVKGDVTSNQSFYGFNNTNTAERVFLIKVDDNKKEEYIKKHFETNEKIQEFKTKYNIEDENFNLLDYKIFAWGSLPVEDENSKKAFRPETSSELLMSKVNTEGMIQISPTLNQRIENTDYYNQKDKLWVRTLYNYLKEDGKLQLNYSTHNFGVQIGKDFYLYEEQDKNNNSNYGLFATYMYGKTSYIDTNHIVIDEETKKPISKIDIVANSDNHYISLGTYGTFNYRDNSYVDVVLNGVLIKNKSTADVTTAGFTLSAEYSKKFILDKLTVQGFLQSTYSVLITPTYLDNELNITTKPLYNLRNRLGLSLSNNDTKNYRAYGIVNAYYDISNNNEIIVGDKTYKEKFNKLWLEMAIGGQKEIINDLHIYADGRFQFAISKNPIERLGAKLSLGIKKEF